MIHGVLLKTLTSGTRAAVVLLACYAATTTPLLSQTPQPLGAQDRTRLAEVVRLATRLRSRIWPGWERTPLAILLVTDSAEYLVGHPEPGVEFTRSGHDSILALDIWIRPRVFSPTLLATFPAVGALPTIVVGTAERTGKSSSEWVLTLLHEHFHQWQYSLPDYYHRVGLLGLAGGDSTGMWMLNYPFPYESVQVQLASKRLAEILARAIDATPAERRRALSAVTDTRADLAAHLTPADNRYLEFQLWQEGVARFIEYQTAAAAASLGPPSARFRTLPDYESYESLARRGRLNLRHELDHFDLGQNKRSSFYPLGAALALLLENNGGDWKRRYEATPFVLTSLLGRGR